MDSQIDQQKADILGCVGRAYAHEQNRQKVVDPQLGEAIVFEIKKWLASNVDTAEISVPLTYQESMGLLETAWGIIANAGSGNWARETKEWQEAACKFRDAYHKLLGGLAFNSMRSEHQQKVDEFMELAKQEVPAIPTMPSEDVRRLRAKLIFEESVETIKALGFDVEIRDVVFCNETRLAADGEYKFIAVYEPDLVEIIDGCADIKVVTTGTLSACGIPDQPFQREVDANNLAKFGPGHTIREDGKLIKPPGHKPPRIREILDNMLNGGEV